MEAFDRPRLLSGHDFSGEPYLEFLRVPSLSAGANDPQRPHTEDEVYHVVSGRGRIRVGAEDLAVLVVFAPAEGSAPSGRAHSEDTEGASK